MPARRRGERQGIQGKPARLPGSAIVEMQPRAFAQHLRDQGRVLGLQPGKEAGVVPAGRHHHELPGHDRVTGRLQGHRPRVVIGWVADDRERAGRR